MFGERAGEIPLIATKALVGHLLGSLRGAWRRWPPCSACATASCTPSRAGRRPIPSCRSPWCWTDRCRCPDGAPAAVSTSLAFGGSNAALVFFALGGPRRLSPDILLTGLGTIGAWGAGSDRLARRWPRATALTSEVDRSAGYHRPEGARQACLTPPGQLGGVALRRPRPGA